MSRAIGIVLMIAGAVWILQSFDIAFAPESFMTGDPMWGLLGGLAVVIGAGLVWRSRSR